MWAWSCSYIAIYNRDVNFYVCCAVQYKWHDTFSYLNILWNYLNRLASSMNGLFSLSFSNFHSAPKRFEISELCIFGFSWAIFLLCPLDQTIKAFMGLLICSWPECNGLGEDIFGKTVQHLTPVLSNNDWSYRHLGFATSKRGAEFWLLYLARLSWCYDSDELKPTTVGIARYFPMFVEQGWRHHAVIVGGLRIGGLNLLIWVFRTSTGYSSYFWFYRSM